MIRFEDRRDAGRRLGARLSRTAPSEGIVLALPRGGVPVAYEVARALDLPLDVYVVRKLGVPGHEELAMGAIASGGVRVLNEDVVAALRIPESILGPVEAREEAVLHEREKLYRGGRPAPRIEGRPVIAVDDGLATGASMRAAVLALRHDGATRVDVAVPVASAQACRELREVADTVVCLATPEPFRAVGLFYENFAQTSDDEVRALLAEAAAAVHEVVR